MLKTSLSLACLGAAIANTSYADCQSSLAGAGGSIPKELLQSVCTQSQRLDNCVSGQGRDIYHFDFKGKDSSGQKILVFSVVHGDEPESGRIAIRWMERLGKLDSRNAWRIVPVLNPDGLVAKQRMNSGGVDLNRNFPSKDWQDRALKDWAGVMKSDPRRYPGPSAGSEVETRCAIDHIEAFRPDFIISIHTPYGVLDFDGPSVAFPKFDHLPWVKMGTYPGSLGRYMWRDQNVPVLTIELKSDELLERMSQVDLLQDISGTVAIRASKKRNQADN
jgi:hypothetical protein